MVQRDGIDGTIEVGVKIKSGKLSAEEDEFAAWSLASCQESRCRLLCFGEVERHWPGSAWPR